MTQLGKKPTAWNWTFNLLNRNKSMYGTVNLAKYLASNIKDTREHTITKSPNQYNLCLLNTYPYIILAYKCSSCTSSKKLWFFSKGHQKIHNTQKCKKQLRYSASTGILKTWLLHLVSSEHDGGNDIKMLRVGCLLWDNVYYLPQKLHSQLKNTVS